MCTVPMNPLPMTAVLMSLRRTISVTLSSQASDRDNLSRQSRG